VAVKEKFYYCGSKKSLVPGEDVLELIADKLISRLESYGFKEEYFREQVTALLNGRRRETVGMLEDEITYANFYLHHRQSLAKMIGANKRVLSVGCGINGKLEKLLREQGCYVAGLDIRPKAAQNPGLDRFVLGDMKYIRELPLMQKEKSFDIIVFSESIGYMDEMDILKKAYDFLSPKGRVIITTFPPPKGNKKKASNYKRYTVEKWKKQLEHLSSLFEVDYINEIFLMSYDHMYALPGHVIRIGLEKKEFLKSQHLVQQPVNSENILAIAQAI
jgi:SAM-dependent methyltransferase